MEFQGIKLIPIDLLGLSQIYLNREKIEAVKKWFDPKNLDNFEPLPVRDFGNGIYTLTDGHTRTFVAHQNGISSLPVVYDNDEIVTCKLGQAQYNADIEWCTRFQLKHIWDLENRVLNSYDYQKFWIERCDRNYHLLANTSPEERAQLQSLFPALFLYGATETLSELFFEDKTGKLFSYKNSVLDPEDR